MAGENSTSDSLSGLFKRVYKDIENLVPDHCIITKEVPFVPKNKRVGDDYRQAIIVKSEHGRQTRYAVIA